MTMHCCKLAVVNFNSLFRPGQEMSFFLAQLKLNIKTTQTLASHSKGSICLALTELDIGGQIT